LKEINGREIAALINSETASAVSKLQSSGTRPTLGLVVPTDDEATAWYVRSIKRAAEKVGIACITDEMAGASRQEVVDALTRLSRDPSVHGVMCQTPMPDGISLQEAGLHIAVEKDVDGANPKSLGLLAAGLVSFAPATAEAVVEILQHEKKSLAGARVVVVGRSIVVGKPVALLLLARHATVTICHSRTEDLEEVCSQADILVVAVGKTAVIGAHHVKDGAVIIDVGTNPTADGKLVGDVDGEAVVARRSSDPSTGRRGPSHHIAATQARG
jgi:methylenetetrahydrofolate dehydrogenase (NADP+) / methenyltetrahydrofolate cyclohydrolase